MGLLRNPEVRFPLLAMLAAAGLSLGAIAWFLNGSEYKGLLLWAVGGAFALCAVIFLAASFIHAKKVRAFIIKVDNNLRGQRDLQFDSFREGDFSDLQDAVQKMAVAHARQEDQLTEEKSRLKDSLDNITHQIKTPLHSLTQMAERLMEAEVSPFDRKRAARKILDNAAHIDTLVKTLLKLSRLEAGVVTFRQDVISVEELMEDVCEPLEISMELGEITLKKTFDPAGLTMTGDRLWLNEALTNIVKNCIEHTLPGGTIYIDTTGNAGCTQFVIRDTGSGIPKEELPHIFERFHSGKDAKPNSVGIGLSLSKQVIESMEGWIIPENHPDGGAMFTVTLPKINI